MQHSSGKSHLHTSGAYFPFFSLTFPDLYRWEALALAKVILEVPLSGS